MSASVYSSGGSEPAWSLPTDRRWPFVLRLATDNIIAHADGLDPNLPEYAQHYKNLNWKQPWRPDELLEAFIGIRRTKRAFDLVQQNQANKKSFATIIPTTRLLRVTNLFAYSDGNPDCEGAGHNHVACVRNRISGTNPPSSIGFYGKVSVTQYAVVHEFGHRFDYQAQQLATYSMIDRMGDDGVAPTSTTGDITVYDCGPNGNDPVGTNTNIIFGQSQRGWIRGLRGWGSGPGTDTNRGSQSDSTHYFITDFQQHAGEYSIGKTTITETVADMFLNWAYRSTTDTAANSIYVDLTPTTTASPPSSDPRYYRTAACSDTNFISRQWRGFKNASWVANNQPCATSYAGCPADEDKRKSGNVRFAYMQALVRDILK
jgi:hypothetical protein